MPCRHLSVATCRHCYKEFIVRIAADTAREFLNKFRTYVCPHCRKVVAVQPPEEIECAA